MHKYSSKKSIEQIDWSNPITEETSKILASGYDWVLPQLFALFNNITLIRNDEGLYSFDLTWSKLVDMVESKALYMDRGTIITKSMVINMIKHINSSPRGLIMSGKQIDPRNSRYSSSVPLFISIFKQYRNIPYKDWCFTDKMAKYLVDKDNLDLITYNGDFLDLTLEELLELRNEVITKMHKQPIGITTIFGFPQFKDVPRLVKLSMLQLWIYTPELRNTNLGILNPKSLDTVPAPLVSPNVIDSKSIDDEIPWKI